MSEKTNERQWKIDDDYHAYAPMLRSLVFSRITRL